ncbi:MAG: hypothetical protein ACRCTI_06015 [Beijerinckiaceae bacterium]
MGGQDGQADDSWAATILHLNRWLKAAAAVLGTDAGCVVATEGDTARIIARHNIPHAFLASHATISQAPFRRDELVLLRDATARSDIHSFLASIALGKTRFFYRRPLQLAGDLVIGMVLFGETPLPHVADRELTLVEEIAAYMAAEIERYYPAGSSDLASSLRMTLPDVRKWIEGTDLPAALLSRDMTLMHVNERLRQLVPAPWDQVEGRPLTQLALPARKGMDLLFRHALATGISTPSMEIELEDSAGADGPRALRVVGSPLKLLDGEQVLVATLDPRVAAEGAASISAQGRNGENATAEFLMETLVRRRALRGRKDVSYVTLRSWRNSIRAHQISALKALKRNAPEMVAGEIAAEIRDDIRSLFGAGGFSAVVPMPCGHSAPGRCLSEAIARSLAKELALPHARALALTPESGSSHPKANTKRQPMRLLTPVEGSVLLVDDVATSGRHIEEATQLLRGAGASVLAIAWIGGDAEKDEPAD